VASRAMKPSMAIAAIELLGAASWKPQPPFRCHLPCGLGGKSVWRANRRLPYVTVASTDRGAVGVGAMEVTWVMVICDLVWLNC